MRKAERKRKPLTEEEKQINKWYKTIKIPVPRKPRMPKDKIKDKDLEVILDVKEKPEIIEEVEPILIDKVDEVINYYNDALKALRRSEFNKNFFYHKESMPKETLFKVVLMVEMEQNGITIEKLANELAIPKKRLLEALNTDENEHLINKISPIVPTAIVRYNGIIELYRELYKTMLELKEFGGRLTLQTVMYMVYKYKSSLDLDSRPKTFEMQKVEKKLEDYTKINKGLIKLYQKETGNKVTKEMLIKILNS